MSRILLVEDESNVREPLAAYLEREGFTVKGVDRISVASNEMNSEKFDLVLLDWMLPDGAGIDFLKRWREGGIETPVIFLTAKSELVDKVLGLEVGANDYMTKPFELRELLSRIRVQLRSKKRGVGEWLRCGRVEISEERREALFDQRKVSLTKTEFELLKLFVESPGQVFSREELLNKVWGYENYPTTRTVDMHVLQLRQKFDPKLFETVHGVGYRFKSSENFSNILHAVDKTNAI